MNKKEYYDRAGIIPETKVFAEEFNKLMYLMRTGEGVMGSLPVNLHYDIGVANIYEVIVAQGHITSLGTSTDIDTNKLIDNGATFESDGIKIGHTVLNLTDNSEEKVVSIDSQIQLTLNSDIFTGSSKDYKIGPDILQIPQTYIEGLTLKIKAANNNTGISTLNVNGLGAKNIKLSNGNNIPADTIISDKVFIVDYDGADFVIRLAGSGNGGAVSGGIDTILTLLYLIKERKHDISQIDDKYLLQAFIRILNFECTLGNEYISGTEILLHLDYNSLHDCEATTDLSNEGAQSGAVALNSVDKIEGSNSVKTTITSGLNGVENGIVYTLPTAISLQSKFFRVGAHLSTITNIDRLRVYLYSDTDYKYWDFTSGLVADFNHLEVDPTTVGNGSSGILDINIIDKIKVFAITNATQSLVLSIDDLCNVSNRNIPIKQDIQIVNIISGAQEIFSLTVVSGVKCTMDTGLSSEYNAANSAIKRNMSITDTDSQSMSFIEGLSHEFATHTILKRLLEAVTGAKLDTAVMFEGNVNYSIAVINNPTSFSLQDDLIEKDSYDISNKDATEDGYDVNWNGQAVGNSETYYIVRVDFYLQKSGTPTGNCYALVYACTGAPGTNGKPTGAILAISNAINVSTIGSGSPEIVSFYLTNPYQVTDDYCIILKYDGGGSSDKILFGIDSSSPAHSGNFSYTDDGGTNWYVDAAKDSILYIYTFEAINELKSGYSVGFYKKIDIGTEYSYPQSDMISNINADLTIENNLPTISIADALPDVEIADYVVLLPNISYSLVPEDNKETFINAPFNKLNAIGFSLDQSKEIFSDAFNRSDGTPGNNWNVTVEPGGSDENKIRILNNYIVTHGYLTLYADSRMYRNLENYDESILVFDLSFNITYSTINTFQDARIRVLIGSNLANSGEDGIGIEINVLDNLIKIIKSNITLATLTYTFIMSTYYNVRLLIASNYVKVKVWKRIDNEPNSYILEKAVDYSGQGNYLNIWAKMRTVSDVSAGNIHIDDIDIKTHEDLRFLASGTKLDVSGQKFSLRAEMPRGDINKKQSKITGYAAKIIV